MLSRVALLPRACLTCRLGLAQRRTTLWAYNYLDCPQRPRRYASNASVQSKERIEALISGALDNCGFDVKDGRVIKRKGNRGGKRRKGSRNRKGRDDEELASWELPQSEESSRQTTSTHRTTNLTEQSKPTPTDAQATTQSDLGSDKRSAADLSKTSHDIPFVLDDLELNEPPDSSPEEQTHSQATSRSRPRSDGKEAAKFVKPFRHDLLQHQKLGVEALGRPMEALVIKNPNKMRSTKTPLPVLEEEAVGFSEPLRVDDIFSPEEESASVVSAEVWRNIDELRPTDATVLRRKEMEKLMDALVDGFTKEQLASYFNRGDWDHILQANNTPAYPWIVKQGRWKAAYQNHWASLKPKQRQAIMIMTTKWNLEIQEQVESVGGILVWLQPDVFRLIARPPGRVLETVRAEFLDESNSETISPNFEESRLAIYSRKSALSTILAHIDEAVRSIKTKKVSVKHVRPDGLRQLALEELGRITNTFLQYNAKESELSISWLPDNDRHEPSTCQDQQVQSSGRQEDPADIILRLLSGRQPRLQTNEVHIINSLENASPQAGVFVEHHRERRTMAWRDKLRHWSRYVNPITKQKTAEGGKPLGLPDRVPLPKPTLKRADDRTTDRITATFGYVLHTQPATDEVKMAKNRRILAPVVPHPASFTPITSNPHAIAQSTAIVLNFSPDPTQAGKLGDAAPQVRLRLPVDPKADLSAFAFPPDSLLEAVVPCHVHDVLLPDESVDVRLVQQRHLPLDANQRSLQEFLAASEFNLLAGRLKTPIRTQFSIPTKWLSNKPKSFKSSKKVTSVPYMFMGLEIHQITDLDWLRCTLRYNSIEAGQHGGQRQELSLHAVPPSSHGKNLSQETVKDFLRLVEEVATGKHFSWDEGHKFMQERSDEKFSWDMLDNDSFDDDEQIAAQEGDAEDSRHAPPNHGAAYGEQRHKAPRETGKRATAQPSEATEAKHADAEDTRREELTDPPGADEMPPLEDRDVLPGTEDVPSQEQEDGVPCETNADEGADETASFEGASGTRQAAFHPLQSHENSQEPSNGIGRDDAET